MTALRIRNLNVALENGDPVVEGVDLELRRGEILGVVGESGSGKTTTALALLGYSTPGAHITSGQLEIAGETLVMDDSMRSRRGSLISYVPQNPGRSLNPSVRVFGAIEDILRTHGVALSKDHGAARQLLDTVGLDSRPAFGKRFPHQLSGGQQQRVCIAAALACEPEIVVLDEPTTGLDVVSQSRILRELVRLRDERQVSMVYVTHDLGVVAQIADRVAVMYAGRVVEHGPTSEVLGNPRHPYTRGLLASTPDHLRPRLLEPIPGIAAGVGDRSTGCAFAPRCSLATSACLEAVPALVELSPDRGVRCVHAERTPPLVVTPLELSTSRDHLAPPLLEVRELRAEHRGRGETAVAAANVSFAVPRGSCVALVGESGSGKTTIARVVAGLHPRAGGLASLDGEVLHDSVRRRTAEQRRRIQLVFQNPAEALNPRHRVGDIVARPAQTLRGLSRGDAHTEVETLLDQVRLPRRLADRYPTELSGGERQRVAIARALAARPDLILCDEVTSALDVSVQAAVLEVLGDLRAELGLSLLFISHDLGTIATIADQVVVLQHGEIVEAGDTSSVLLSPRHSYTQALLAAAPSVSGITDHAAAIRRRQ